MAKSMSIKTVTLRVPVTFTGAVEVTVPESVPEERRAALAEKLATARILATTENPDGPEDDACMEYVEEFNLTEEQGNTDWDGCDTPGVSGAWECGKATPQE